MQFQRTCWQKIFNNFCFKDCQLVPLIKQIYVIITKSFHVNRIEWQLILTFYGSERYLRIFSLNTNCQTIKLKLLAQTLFVIIWNTSLASGFSNLCYTNYTWILAKIYTCKAHGWWPQRSGNSLRGDFLTMLEMMDTRVLVPSLVLNKNYT